MVVGIVLLLFGATKIPQFMRSAGQGVAEFGREVKKGQKTEGDAPEQGEDEEKP